MTQQLKTVSIGLAAALLAASAGCVTTDATGKPIAREAAPTKQSVRDAAMAEALLDGSRIVASGRPGSVAFLYPGTGRLTVRDLTDRTIPFSTEDVGVKTLFAITADGRLTGSVSKTPDAPSVTELATVAKAHEFVITYLPASAGVQK